MKTIRSKITIGVIFLFSVIVTLSIVGIVFVNQLAEKSKGTIKENYNSVDYTVNMLMYLNNIEKYTDNSIYDKILIFNKYNNIQEEIKRFRTELEKESNNLTEPGEEILSNELTILFNDYVEEIESIDKANISEDLINVIADKHNLIKNNILMLYKINTDAVKSKMDKLLSTADDVTLYMTLIGTLAILITLSFVYNFPSNIIEPIKELTHKIKSISENNYNQSLEVKSDDELGELAIAFNNMVERLKLYEEKQIDKLLFEQKRLETLVRNIEDGILFIDESKNIVLVNNTMIKITSLDEDEIINKHINDVSSKNDLIKELYRIYLNRCDGEDKEISPVRITIEGKEYFFNVEIEEIITYSKTWKKDTFIGTLILLRNITEYQERDKAKSNLLATVSHELKTPLSSINLSLKLLDDIRIGELNIEQKEILNSLRQQSNRLSKVIKELLDYSQIETGNIRLNFAPAKPDAVIDIGITALMMQISEKSIELQTIIDDKLPVINIDFEKLVFVFINILNNAIRYSKSKDEIIVEVRKNGNNIEFSVKDNGMGISEEDIPKLFQKFTQVGEKYQQGWGLGLAISKEFVSAQGGKIWVESEFGKGSKFIFTVPVIKMKNL
ncbi:MAG: ATP-binding protein [Melioribacteraceae bacterium]|nr:ATP-binding protein [Melioribacteraceae bacterium]